MGLSKTQRILVFSELGKALRSLQHNNSPGFAGPEFATQMDTAIHNAFIHNGWFEPRYVRKSLTAWGDLLTIKTLTEWTRQLPEYNSDPKRVGLIMAGNIPLVGFHDLLAVLIAGHRVVIKPSSDDNQLLPVIIQTLLTLAPEWEHFITTTNRVKNIDAIIATGSNNSARYFEHYFSHIPHIIRKNRHSIAIVNENTSDEALEKLGSDITDYFGKGCRSVSKVYLPEKFDLDRIFKGLYPYSEIIQNKKYGNNCDYHRAIFLMNQIPILENGFMILREHADLASPVAVLHYERFKNLEDVKQAFENQANEIQCVVAEDPSLFPRTVDFGTTQCPALDDYADGVDTLTFLSGL
jgi:hypothetical protein